MIFTTIACANYLPKALFLANTVRALNRSARIILCLFERTLHPCLSHPHEFNEVILAKQLPITGFDSFVFRHSLLEATTAIKATHIRDLLSRYPNENQVVYLDPDIQVFGRFTELPRLFRKHQILVTPHQLKDESTEGGVTDNVLRTLQCGTFNLGFIAVKRGSVSKQFLDWWHRRLMMMCYVDFSRGLFVDQKWIDLAIGMFPIGIIRHPGYNVANWNISTRRITGSTPSVNGHPLRFFHFSGIDTGKDQRFFLKYAPYRCHSHWLRAVYKHQIDLLGHQEMRNIPWSYDFFNSGERITMDARMACRRNPGLLRSLKKPYSRSNEEFLELGY